MFSLLFASSLSCDLIMFVCLFDKHFKKNALSLTTIIHTASRCLITCKLSSLSLTTHIHRTLGAPPRSLYLQIPSSTGFRSV